MTFPKLTEEYFKSSPWPDAEEVAPIVQEDQLFLILYKELYYRHIYARVQGGPTIEQRLVIFCRVIYFVSDIKMPSK